MNREKAEKLLAALIFDDLDEASKSKLLTYLQTDDELRERLADMRMAAKVASDTLQQGPEPVLGKRRMKSLARLAGRRNAKRTIFTLPRIAAAAAVIAVVLLPVLFILPGSSRVRLYSRNVASESEYAGELPEVSSQPTQPFAWSSESKSKYAYDPADETQQYSMQTEIRNSSPSVRELGETQKYSLLPPVTNRPPVSDAHYYTKSDGEEIAGTEISLSSGDNLYTMGEADRFVGGQLSVPGGDPSASRSWRGSASHDDYIANALGSEPSSGMGISGGGGMMGGYGGGGYGGGMMGGMSEGGDTRGDGIYASYSGKADGVTRGPGGVGGDVGGGIYSFPGATELVTGSDVSKDFGKTISGKPISNPVIANNIFSDGQNVTFINGHLDMAETPEGFTIATGPESASPAIPGGDNIYAVWNGKAGGTSGPSDRPDLTLLPQGGAERVVAADSGGEVYSFQIPDTVDMGYGYTETLNWEVDQGAEARKRDHEKAQLPFAISGTIKQHGLRSEVFKEEVVSSLDKAAEKHDTASTEYGGRPVLIVVDELGVSRGEGRGRDGGDNSPETTEPVKVEINGRVPILGDVPLLGSLFRREGGKKTLPEEQSQRTAKSLEDIKSALEDKAERTESESSIPASPSLDLMKLGRRDADGKKAKESSAEAKKQLPKLNVAIGADATEVTGEPMPSTGEVKLERWNVADGDAIVIDSGFVGKEPALAGTDTDPDGSTIFTPTVIDSKSAPRKLSPRSDLNGPISQPEGKPAETEYEIINLKHIDPRQVQDSVADGFRDLSETQASPKVLIEPLKETGQIIVFGRKDMREKVKDMIEVIDKPRPQVAFDVNDITIVRTEEDGSDLPEASRFKLVPVNPWVMAGRDSLSTFALDVDTASYTLCRRYIRGGFLPPAGAVRMEEFVNYFNYQYPQRTNPTFKVHAEAARSPFAGKGKDLTLLKIGVKARTIGRDQRKAAHLILVVDASASMGQPDRLGLVQKALGLLVDKLSAADRVSLITCADEARLHIEATSAGEREKIHEAIDSIQPSGSTNLLAGLKLGYATARRAFAPKQINHVILCSDGVANVGQTEAEAVLKAVAAERKQGITITCVGVGYGSYNDAFLEALANRGDGSYVFLDSAGQAQRVFVEQLAATLQTVAKDARIQVDFNPNRVRRYRLIGYENRDIEDKRFRDDTIDAGEVGSGQCSTALYELELIGTPSADRQEDLGAVFVRYRHAETGRIEEISSRLRSSTVRRRTIESAPRFYLAACAARFAEILRQSEHAQDGNLADVLRVAEQVNQILPLDRDVRELAELIRKAEHLPASP